MIYLPAFLIPFSVHDDGAIVSGQGNIMDAFDENRFSFMLGRPLYVFYLGIQANLIPSVEVLSVFRVISYIQLYIALWFIWNFLKSRCRISQTWLSLIMLNMFFIPAHMLSLLWVEAQVTGIFTLLLACASYYFLSMSLQRPIFLIFSATVFLLALCAYPATALTVFFFTMSQVLFVFKGNEKELRGIIIRDIVFFGSLMFVYFLLMKFALLPWASTQLHVIMPTGVYAFSLFTNIHSKWLVFFDIVGHVLRGTWGLMGVAVGYWMMFGLSSFLILINRIKIKEFVARLIADRQRQCSLGERCIWLLILFICMNAAILMAGGCSQVWGYRMLVPSGMLGVLLLFKLFIKGNNKKLAIVFTVVTLMVALYIEINVIRNNHMEYALAQKQLSKIDLAQTNRLLFVLNPMQNTTWLGHPLPLEMGIMSWRPSHVKAYVQKVFDKKADKLFIQTAFPDQDAYLNSSTALIDLTVPQKSNLMGIRHNSKMLKLNSLMADHVLLNVSPEDKSPLIMFQTIFKNINTPLWLVLPQERITSIELEDMYSPKSLLKYSCVIESKNEAGELKEVSWKLQGSNDRQHWVDLDAQSSLNPLINSKFKICDVHYPQEFRYYRITWFKADPEAYMYIHLLQFFFRQ